MKYLIVLLLIVLQVAYGEKKLKKRPSPGLKLGATGPITCTGAKDLKVVVTEGEWWEEAEFKVVVEVGAIGPSCPESVYDRSGSLNTENWTPQPICDDSIPTIVGISNNNDESECIDMTPYDNIFAMKIIAQDAYGDGWAGGSVQLTYNGVTSSDFTGPTADDSTNRVTWTVDNIQFPNAVSGTGASLSELGCQDMKGEYNSRCPCEA